MVAVSDLVAQTSPRRRHLPQQQVDHTISAPNTNSMDSSGSQVPDSDVSMALARTGDLRQGSRTLSLFLIPPRLPLLRDLSSPVSSSMSNWILVHRLKNKIGTQVLPTAELSINNSTAYLICPHNQGVKNIPPVLNITRLYSCLSSVGNLRKCLAIANAYAKCSCDWRWQATAQGHATSCRGACFDQFDLSGLGTPCFWGH